MFDKGPGDIRIGNLLIDLKKRYWDRCFLIIGNRDANKLRLLSEINDDAEVEKLPLISAVSCKISPSDYLKQHNLSDTKPNRLKWMLEHTWGSPDAFEFRRLELSIVTKSDIKNITDEDVVKRAILIQLLPTNQIILF